MNTTPGAGVSMRYRDGQFTYWVGAGPAVGCGPRLKTLGTLLLTWRWPLRTIFLADVVLPLCAAAAAFLMGASQHWRPSTRS
jgi:hypothetical protein